MTSPHPKAEGGDSRLMHFPITFFATTMGFGGFSLALRAAAKPLELGALPYQVALAVTAVLFAVLLAVYGLKAALHWKEVFAEWHHPIRLSFFPTIAITLLLLSIGLLTVSKTLALLFWGLGTALQGVLTLAVVTNWIGTRSFQHGHLNPAWFIPAVGNIIVPVAGPQLGFVELSWLFFSVGLMFWLILMTLVFNRLVFHDPLPGRLQPTLVIMIAPPAVGFIAWVRLTMGEGAVVDPMGHVLLSLAYGFAALVAVQLPRILRLPFAMSFWALSFPLAALTIATFLYAEVAHSMVHERMGTAFLAMLAVLLAGLVGRTLIGMSRGEICRPE